MATGGTAALALMSLVRNTSIIAANGPMALAISFAPWLNAKPDAVSTCIHEKIKNVDLATSLRFRFLAYRKVADQMPAPSIKITKLRVRLLMFKCRLSKPLNSNMVAITMPPTAEIVGTQVYSARNT